MSDLCGYYAKGQPFHWTQTTADITVVGATTTLIFSFH